MNKLRQRILKKVAQDQGAQPTATPAVIPPPPPAPSILFSHLSEGYNGGTVSLIISLTQQLNKALHYASNGKANFQKIIDGNLDLSGADPDEKNVGTLCKKWYVTFLNSRNTFAGQKVPGKTIATWVNDIITSPEYGNLSQVNPTSALATKLPGNLKTIIQDSTNQIKGQNPANS
jgi:hypothetical protein